MRAVRRKAAKPEITAAKRLVGVIVCVDINGVVPLTLENAAVYVKPPSARNEMSCIFVGGYTVSEGWYY